MARIKTDIRKTDTAIKLLKFLFKELGEKVRRDFIKMVVWFQRASTLR